MGFINWLLRRAQRPREDWQVVEEWGEFPPTPSSATSREDQRYLEYCSFGGLRIHADNRLTVVLLDAADQPWSFHFPNAGLSMKAWPDGVPPFPEGLGSENYGPQSSITYLDTTIRQDRKGVTTHTYELETTVLLMHIDSDLVQVRPPKRGVG